MPGRLFLTTPIAEVAAALGAEHAGAEDSPPRRNIAPGQELVVCTPERVLVPMRWGIIPVGRVNARGRPVMETVINARSETVFEKSAFEGVGRCIVPADGWYEWTGEARRKTAWRLRLKSREVMAFAAVFDVWAGPGGVKVPQVATLTCPPNAEVAPVHHRMGAILSPADFQTWLTGPQNAAAALLAPLPEGRLVIERADDVDWSKP